MFQYITFTKRELSKYSLAELSHRCTCLLIRLSHARNCLPDGVIKVLVTALVILPINYCLTVYGNGTHKIFDRLQKILNFAARVIFGRRKFDHVSDLRDRLGWLSPKSMSDYLTLTVAHKVIKHGEPEKLAALFVHNQNFLAWVELSREVGGAKSRQTPNIRLSS